MVGHSKLIAPRQTSTVIELKDSEHVTSSRGSGPDPDLSASGLKRPVVPVPTSNVLLLLRFIDWAPSCANRRQRRPI